MANTVHSELISDQHGHIWGDVLGSTPNKSSANSLTLQPTSMETLQNQKQFSQLCGDHSLN